MNKVVVTGGSGGVGTYVVKHLIENNYRVLNLDQIKPVEEISPFVQVDLTEYGRVFACLQDYDAVVHLAANPEPDFDFVTGADRFKNNTLTTFNVFNAAVASNMQKIVWASSETVLGFPFEKNKPGSVPVDETHQQQPQNGYALSKVVCEELARHMNRLYETPFIGLELSNVLYPNTSHHDNYERIPDYWLDPNSRKFNLWGYIDVRDVATSVRLSLESDIQSAENFIIAAKDTIMNIPNQELINCVFPGVPIKDGTTEYQSFLNTDKAKRMLGFKPKYSWRNIIDNR